MNLPTETDLTLLLVEDDNEDARFVEQLLSQYQSVLDADGVEGLIGIDEVVHEDTLAGGIDRIRSTAPDVILLDLMLPDSEGLETVDRVVDHATDIPIVVLTGSHDEEMGVGAIQHGAQEYLRKGAITADLLVRSLRYAIERQRTHQQLADRTYQLALLNEIVRQDIRNDVSMIVGLGDQLQRATDRSNRQLVNEVLAAAEHVVELTDTAAQLGDALSTEGIDIGRTDVVPLVEAKIEELLEQQDCSVRFEPPTEQPVTVSASPMLGSVFSELLANAVEHSHRDQPEITVEIETTAESVTVTVADDGPGIPDRQKSLLLDPESRSDGQSAMGVGLYLVTTIVDQLDGEFELEDNEPTGTRASVTLDRAGASPD